MSIPIYTKTRAQKKRGRKRKRGVRKGSTGARSGAARRSQVYQNLKRQGLTEVSTEGITVSIEGKRQRQIPKRRELYGRRKRALVTEKPVSPRHQEGLIMPGLPFQPGRRNLLSTAINKFDYDPKTQTLDITFWGYKQRWIGDTYRFFAVPYHIYEGLLSASSKGRYFYYVIRGHYQYRRMG